MQTMKRAKILSASAGSGKTYQLTLKYMCDVIQHPERYRNILAVTFTNKATEEMKSRILREIHRLAAGEHSQYIEDIKREIVLGEKQIREGAKRAQTRILHDFSRFTILTIDRFFQRILRAFIKELSLDLNYNIELDTNLLLERSTDALVEGIIEDEQLKKWLLEFAEERLEEGERWDMRGDLKSLGKELFKEGGAKRSALKFDKNGLRDIIKALDKETETHRNRIVDLGINAIQTMKECGVAADEFRGSSTSFVFNFYRYAEGELKTPTATMLKAKDDITAWHKKGDEARIIAAAERLMPILNEICECYNIATKRANTAKLIKNNYRGFALLADLKKRIDDICSKENIMVLSKTRDILSTFIDDNNAPFIYEKVGSRYDHYMIDEFQDTSVRDWHNILPLLREALSSNPSSSVFIVGDIKQSIYRWRGGDWRLLNNDAIVDLGEENTAIEHLQKNYRSLPNIVKFNNELIERVVELDNNHLNECLNKALEDKKIEESTYSFLHDTIVGAYCDHKQIPAMGDADYGYAEVVAYDSMLTDSPFIRAIESAIERGYRYRDILILVRGGTDSRKVADALFAYKEQKFISKGLPGFNILTPDALTLANCDIAEFIIAVMRLAIDPKNDIERGIHNRYLGYPLDRVFGEDELQWLRHIAHLSPLEAFEEIVSRFSLDERSESIASLQAIHEQILSFSTQRVADIQYYLKWWDEKGGNEAITVEMTDDTIEITTIHKAKGLERDIVIIPYSCWDMAPRPALHSIVWAKSSDAKLSGAIGEFPVAYSNTMEHSDFSDEYYKELVMSHVDGVNLLYVAVTRASKELYMYVPTKLQTKDKSGSNISTTAPLILQAAKSISPTPKQEIREGELITLTYSFGKPTDGSSMAQRGDGCSDILLEEYTSHKPTIKVRYPSHRCIEEGVANSNKALSEGIRLHRLFEGAITEQDLREAVRRMSLDCVVDQKQAKELNDKITTMVTEPLVHEWFSGEWDDVKCESAIIFKENIRIPDRVMIKGTRAVIVDYKFGDKQLPIYKKQLLEYVELLESMGQFSQVEAYVWYISLGVIDKIV